MTRNNIDSALIRLDFVPIDELNESLPKAIRDSVDKKFSENEFREVNNSNIELSPAGEVLNKEIQKMREWHFFSPQTTQRIILTQSSLVLKCNGSDYSSFEDFVNSYASVCDALFATYPNTTITRIGLRYMNKFQEDDDSIATCYLKDILSTPVAERVRIMTIIERKLQSHQLRMQYGLFNPDYPSVDVKKEIILDMDAYSNGLFYSDELASLLDELHSTVEAEYCKFVSRKASEQ